MPTLHWIRKDKVINHHMDVPCKVLEHTYGFDDGTHISDHTDPPYPSGIGSIDRAWDFCVVGAGLCVCRCLTDLPPTVRGFVGKKHCDPFLVQAVNQVFIL